MASQKIRISGYYTIISFLFLIIVDKMTKIWALTLAEELDYGIFSFVLTMNTGAGFSILKDSNTLLIWIAVIALGALIYFREHFPGAGFVLIISGVFGNLLDRMMHGYVIDFINLKFWPVFNAADSFIFIGAIITAVYWWRQDKKTSGKRKKISLKTRKKKTAKRKKAPNEKIRKKTPKISKTRKARKIKRR